MPQYQRVHNSSRRRRKMKFGASALQFVRKLSGFARRQSQRLVFNRAVDEVAKTAHELLHALVTNAPPRDRDAEA